MNKVEEKAYKIIKDAVKNRDFIDWEALYNLHETDGIKALVCISPKGIAGKSTGAINHIVKNIKKDDFTAAWLRNTETEKRGSDLDSSFTKALLKAGLNKDFIVRAHGVYQILDKDNKMDKGLLKTIFAYVNLPLNIGSQNALACKFIVYDEMINPNFNKPHLAYDVYNMIKSLQRTENALFVALGNAHEADNDLLNAFGIEFDWESGETQVIYNEKKKLLAIYIEAYKNKYMEKADDDTDNLFSDCDEVKQFSAGKVANNNIWGCKNWYVHNIEEMFTPVFSYDLNNDLYTVGTLKSKDPVFNGKVYVKQETSQTYNVARLCYKVTDKRVYNTYVCDLDNYSTVKFLLNNYSQGNLMFSTAWGRDAFIQFLLPSLQLFMNDEKKRVVH